MNCIEDISTDMTAVVENLARRFALEDDDDTVEDIRKLKVGLVTEATKLHPFMSNEIEDLAKSLLRSVLIRRGEIGLCAGSNPSKAVH